MILAPSSKRQHETFRFLFVSALRRGRGEFLCYFLQLILASICPAASAFALDFGATPAWGSGPAHSTSKKSIKDNYRPAVSVENQVPEISELHKYLPGTVVFNPQPTMSFNEWHTFQVIISRQAISTGLINKIVSTMRRNTFIQYTSLEHVTKRMILEITQDNPGDFEISPNSPVILDVVKDATQEFSVKPLQVGQLNLYLKVKALISDTETKRDVSIAFPELSKKITIEISPVGTSKFFLTFLKEYWMIISSPLVLLVSRTVRETLVQTFVRLLNRIRRRK